MSSVRFEMKSGTPLLVDFIALIIIQFPYIVSAISPFTVIN